MLETPAQGVGTRELVVVGPLLVADGQGEEFRLFGERWRTQDWGLIFVQGDMGEEGRFGVGDVEERGLDGSSQEVGGFENHGFVIDQRIFVTESEYIECLDVVVLILDEDGSMAFVGLFFLEIEV